jgi:hypothetical protein
MVILAPHDQLSERLYCCEAAQLVGWIALVAGVDGVTEPLISDQGLVNGLVFEEVEVLA